MNISSVLNVCMYVQFIQVNRSNNRCLNKFLLSMSSSIQINMFIFFRNIVAWFVFLSGYSFVFFLRKKKIFNYSIIWNYEFCLFVCRNCLRMCFFQGLFKKEKFQIKFSLKCISKEKKV